MCQGRRGVNVVVTVLSGHVTGLVLSGHGANVVTVIVLSGHGVSATQVVHASSERTNERVANGMLAPFRAFRLTPCRPEEFSLSTGAGEGASRTTTTTTTTTPPTHSYSNVNTTYTATLGGR
ncbi:hypothetical protein C0Q70_00052 [Pomacea canaliculata]|uniref:Uncharacterized protein n=1 Tax=Pomacea canaliculata TaxID=400727 RepID=A0A2T7PVL3_POMCA|nr:hypothetical protein C0Q70_00052 [Pomacea canaliculata]